MTQHLGKRHGRCPSVQKDSGWRIPNQWRRSDGVQIAIIADIRGSSPSASNRFSPTSSVGTSIGTINVDDSHILPFRLARISDIAYGLRRATRTTPTSQTRWLSASFLGSGGEHRRRCAARCHTWRTARCTDPGLPGHVPTPSTAAGSSTSRVLLEDYTLDSRNAEKVANAAEAILLDDDPALASSTFTRAAT